MKFITTPEEARTVGERVVRYLNKSRLSARIECTYSADAPYVTTAIGTGRGVTVLVEAQYEMSYNSGLRKLSYWLSANRHNSELYIAVGENTSIVAGLLHELAKDGVGLMIVSEDGSINEEKKARNPVYVVSPDPTLRYGPYKKRVEDCVKDFNSPSRKAALREMCEIVEELTFNVIQKMINNEMLNIPVERVRRMGWSNQINMLSAQRNYTTGQVIDGFMDLHPDLHAFRNTRNLVDHRVSSRREDIRRQRQYVEKMMMGTRLVSEMCSLRRRVTR